MMKRVVQWSAFFLAVVVLGFLLHPAAAWIVTIANDGVSSGYNSAGLYWSRPYTRFIPEQYESGFALALSLGLAALCACGVFYAVGLTARRKRGHGQAKTATKHTRRLLLIPVWLLAQYVHNLLSGMSMGQALAMMTSLESLLFSLVVVVVVVLYANGYQVAFGGAATQEQKLPDSAGEIKK
jgi:hypothetical protein